jgi:hypothetical protein
MRRLSLSTLGLIAATACGTDNSLHERDTPLDEPHSDTAVPIDESPPEDTVEEPPEDTSPPPTGCTPGEPVANAGADATVSPLQNVLISGIGSTDPGGCLPLRYQWSLVSKPPGSTLSLGFPVNPNNREIRPFLDIAGDYTFRLAVQNSLGTWDPTPDEVTIHAVPTQELYVQLTWDTDVDLDLHLLNGTGGIFERPGDACYCNKNPEWGAATATDNPSLDWDVVNGYGPETTTIRAPAPGDLDIRVHYYGANGSASCTSCPRTNATVKIFNQATLLQTLNFTLNNQGEVWHVAKMNWPSQVITPDGTLSTTSLTGCQ